MPGINQRLHQNSLPANAGMHFTITALNRLLESPHANGLLRYFGAVDVFIEESHETWQPEPECREQDVLHADDPPGNLRQTYDVLLVSHATRRNEIAWLTALLRELLRARLRVLCLAPRSTQQWAAFQNFIPPAKADGSAVTSSLIDPSSLFAPSGTTIDASSVRDWQLFHSVLRPLGLRVNPGVYGLFRRAAEVSAIWQRMLARVSARCLITVNNHAPHYVPAAVAAHQKGLHVATFQHSVLTSMPSVCPTFADVMYCHGAPSKALLEKASLNVHGFRPVYRSIGMWNQPEKRLVPRPGTRRVLLIDQESDWSKSYFGNAGAYAELRGALHELLLSRSDVFWRARLHYDNDQPDFWQKMSAEFGDRLEVSRADSIDLVEDLQDISLVAGFFSTTLCEAARLGFPVLFLNRPSWFFPQDLAVFRPLRMSVAEFCRRCTALLEGGRAWEKLRQETIDAAGLYYDAARRGLQSVADDIRQVVG